MMPIIEGYISAMNFRIMINSRTILKKKISETTVVSGGSNGTGVITERLIKTIIL